MRAFRLYNEYDGRGALPCAGGVTDQPETLMDAFREIDRQRAYWDKKLDEHNQREAKKRA